MTSSENKHSMVAVAQLFDMRADFVNAHPYGSDHINDTYRAYYDQTGQRIHYIHQRLAENVDRVTSHAFKNATRRR